MLLLMKMHGSWLEKDSVKFDLIRWNLLAEKIQEFKDTYYDELMNESNPNYYPEKVYFNYTDETKTKIYMSSVTWYGLP